MSLVYDKLKELCSAKTLKNYVKKEEDAPSSWNIQVSGEFPDIKKQIYYFDFLYSVFYLICDEKNCWVHDGQIGSGNTEVTLKDKEYIIRIVSSFKEYKSTICIGVITYFTNYGNSYSNEYNFTPSYPSYSVRNEIIRYKYYDSIDVKFYGITLPFDVYPTPK